MKAFVRGAQFCVQNSEIITTDNEYIGHCINFNARAFIRFVGNYRSSWKNAVLSEVRNAVFYATRKIPNVLSRCHTKRRTGTCGNACPSFGMTPTFKIFFFRKKILIFFSR